MILIAIYDYDFVIISGVSYQNLPMNYNIRYVYICFINTIISCQ